VNRQDPDLLHDDFPTTPLVVSPREACRLLSVGLTRLYEILNAGELDSFLVGRSRRMTVASIHAYIQLQRAVPTPVGRKRRRSEVPGAVLTSFEATLADTAVSMSKVIETVIDSVMLAVAREMSKFGYYSFGEDRAIREAIYPVVARMITEAAIRKMNQEIGKISATAERSSLPDTLRLVGDSPTRRGLQPPI
jgi:excisionase family DNA binding protein